jgi:hypothetical protein
MTCFVCKGPWSEPTGGIHRTPGPGGMEQVTFFCGMCERGLVTFVKEHMNRRWGGARFYEHAFYTKDGARE